MRGARAVLLVSCYELGHQPFGIASAWAQLERAGFGVAAVDASIEPVEDSDLEGARLVAISVPMHTALRLGVEIARRVRAQNPAAHVCFFGLYAALNAPFLLDAEPAPRAAATPGRGGVAGDLPAPSEALADSVIGGEFEAALVDLAAALEEPTIVPVPGVTTRDNLRRAAPGAPHATAAPVLRRLSFERPRREGLPALERYARLLGPRAGEERVVGYLEASRGCLHRCTHCPITPVYDGRFFIVPREIVLADAAQQVAAGARHLTFGDPDFLNGVGHSMAIARELHAAHPEVTFDVTVKVAHILEHRARFRELGELGCIFVVSALESLSERVLIELDKGHSRADIIEALRITADAGVALRPSFVAFTPWTTLGDYLELCDFILDRGLVHNVDPIQLAIRLLIPPGSAVLRGEAARPWLGALAREELTYRWTHPDPRMDRLHAEVSAAVEDAARTGEEAGTTFERIRGLAYAAAGEVAPPIRRGDGATFVPRLTESWFCCAEPTRVQLEQVQPEQASSCCSKSAP